MFWKRHGAYCRRIIFKWPRSLFSSTRPEELHSGLPLPSSSNAACLHSCPGSSYNRKIMHGQCFNNTSGRCSYATQKALCVLSAITQLDLFLRFTVHNRVRFFFFRVFNVPFFVHRPLEQLREQWCINLPLGRLESLCAVQYISKATTWPAVTALWPGSNVSS